MRRIRRAGASRSIARAHRRKLSMELQARAEPAASGTRRVTAKDNKEEQI